MSINLWDVGDFFTVRTYKRLASRPDTVWANTYELRVTPGGAGKGVEAAEETCAAIVQWEKGLHLNDVQYDRAVFSTFVEDGQPYDPDTFASYSQIGQNGTRTPGGDPLPLHVCLKVRKAVSFGRAGAWLFRRCLAEGEIVAPAGDPALTAAAVTELTGALAAEASSEGDLLATLTAIGAELSMIGVAGGVTRSRQVNGYSAAGVTVKAYNNRYFDRVLGGGGGGA